MSAPPFDAVVTHHLNPFASGVARFNQILAERLDVPFAGLEDPAAAQARHPLISLKVGELDARESGVLTALLDARAGDGAFSCFLHDLGGGALEQRLVSGSAVVLAGNAAVAEQARALSADVREAWAPGLILDQRPFPDADVSVFSFGMAHKVRTELFARLHDLLEASGSSYALYMSNANHATATLRDAQTAYEEMHDVFPDHLYFMGNLSDVAIHNQLLTATYFAAFFPGGVRANNTSVLSAMEHGCVVITNLDEHSPSEFVHGENVIDVDRATALPTDAETLARMRARTLETAAGRSWDRLVEAVRS